MVSSVHEPRVATPEPFVIAVAPVNAPFPAVVEKVTLTFGMPVPYASFTVTDGGVVTAVLTTAVCVSPDVFRTTEGEPAVKVSVTLTLCGLLVALVAVTGKVAVYVPTGNVSSETDRTMVSGAVPDEDVRYSQPVSGPVYTGLPVARPVRKPADPLVMTTFCVAGSGPRATAAKPIESADVAMAACGVTVTCALADFPPADAVTVAVPTATEMRCPSAVIVTID